MKLFIKFILSNTLMALLIGLLMACNSENEVMKTFTFAAPFEVSHFDPHYVDSLMTQHLTGQVYEALVGLDENYKVSIGQGLAQSWTKISNTAWLFKLYPAIKFHNGNHLTTEDVYASWKRAQTSQLPPLVIINIEDIEIIDDFSFIIHTNKIVFEFINELIDFQIMDTEWIKENNLQEVASSHDVVEKFSIRQANGTGLYKLRNLNPNKSIVFEKNTNYWNFNIDTDLDTIVYQTMGYELGRYYALLNNKVQMAFPIGVYNWEEKDDSIDTSHINKRIVSEPAPIFIGLNQDSDSLIGDIHNGKNPFKDIRVREAINLSIDIHSMVQQLTQGLGVGLGIISVDALSFHPEDEALSEPYPYDVERAKQLLKDAGFEKGFSFVLACPDRQIRNEKAICESVKTMLREVNITVELQFLDLERYNEVILGEYETDAYLFVITDNIAHNSVKIVSNILAYPDTKTGLGKYNVGKYKNLGINLITEQLLQLEDSEVIADLVYSAFYFAKRDFGFVPLLVHPVYIGINDNYHASLSPQYRLEFSKIKISEKVK